MKITIFANSYWNLYNFRYNFINHLIKNNFKVNLIASYDEYYKYFNNKNCKLNFVNIKKNNISPISDIKLCYQLYKILKKDKPDFVFLYTIKPNLYGSIMSNFCNINFINTITGLGTLYLKNTYLRVILKLIYKISFIKSKHIFFHNKDDKVIFFKKFKKNVSITPGSGIDIKKFKFRKKTFNKDLKFIFVGRLIKEKGILELLNTFEKILHKFKNVSLDIFGEIDKNNSSKIEDNMFNYYKNVKKINFVGKKDNINNIYMQYDCLILPSYREGCSRAILEASATGLPVLASNVPGCNNIIKDGFNGYLFTSKSEDSLYKSIEKFIKLDKKIFSEMSYNARKKIEENFDEKFVFKQYINVINNYGK